MATELIPSSPRPRQFPILQTRFPFCRRFPRDSRVNSNSNQVHTLIVHLVLNKEYETATNFFYHPNGHHDWENMYNEINDDQGGEN